METRGSQEHVTLTSFIRAMKKSENDYCPEKVITR